MRNPNVMTLKEAEAQGYGRSSTLRRRIFAGELTPYAKIGKTWTVHRRDLEKMSIKKPRK